MAGVVETKFNREQIIPELTVMGDYSHCHEQDCPLIEFVRAIVRNARTKYNDNGDSRKMLDYALGIPKYNPAYNETTVRLFVNSCTYEPSREDLGKEKRLEEMRKYIEEDLVTIKEELTDLLRDFAEDGDYAEYERHRCNLRSAQNMSERDSEVVSCNGTIAAMLIRHGYRPASRRKPEKY